MVFSSSGVLIFLFCQLLERSSICALNETDTGSSLIYSFDVTTVDNKTTVQDQSCTMVSKNAVTGSGDRPFLNIFWENFQEIETFINEKNCRSKQLKCNVTKLQINIAHLQTDKYTEVLIHGPTMVNTRGAFARICFPGR